MWIETRADAEAPRRQQARPLDCFHGKDGPNVRKHAPTLVLAVLLIASAADVNRALAQEPLSSGFTYQGFLKQAGAPVRSTADFEFTMWDASSGGAAIGTTVSLDDILVVVGTFTVQLDFGGVAFNGDARWLEIAVRSPHDPTGTGPFTTLEPRQPVTATPYALQTRGLFVDESGSVGIGSMTPEAGLHVSSASGLPDHPAAKFESTSGGSQIAIKGNSSAYTWSLANGWSEHDDFYVLRYDGVTPIATALAIDAASLNVGIGTPSPTAKLHVSGGDIHVSGGGISIADAGNALRFSDDKYFYEDDNTGEALVYRFNTLQGDPSFILEDGSGADKVKLSIRESSYINGGNVGIGTSTPEQRLDVNGHIRLGARSKIFWQGDGVAGHQGALGIFGIENGRYTVITPHDGSGDPLQDSTIRFGGRGLFDNAHVDLEVSGMVRADGIAFPDGTVQTTAANGPANCLYDSRTYSPGTSCRAGFGTNCCCCGGPGCVHLEEIVLTCQADGTWSTSTSCDFYEECGLPN